MTSASDDAAWTNAECACSADGGAATTNQSATSVAPRSRRSSGVIGADRAARASAISPGSTPTPSSAPSRPPSGSASTTTRRIPSTGHAAASPRARRVAPGAPATDPITMTVTRRSRRARCAASPGQRQATPPSRPHDRRGSRPTADRWRSARQPRRSRGRSSRDDPAVARWRSCLTLASDRRWRLRRRIGSHDVEQLHRRADLQPRQWCLTRIERRAEDHLAGFERQLVGEHAGAEQRASRHAADRLLTDEVGGRLRSDGCDAVVDRHASDAQVGSLDWLTREGSRLPRRRHPHGRRSRRTAARRRARSPRRATRRRRARSGFEVAARRPAPGSNRAAGAPPPRGRWARARLDAQRAVASLRSLGLQSEPTGNGKSKQGADHESRTERDRAPPVHHRPGGRAAESEDERENRQLARSTRPTAAPTTAPALTSPKPMPTGDTR